MSTASSSFLHLSLSSWKVDQITTLSLIHQMSGFDIMLPCTHSFLQICRHFDNYHDHAFQTEREGTKNVMTFFIVFLQILLLYLIRRFEFPIFPILFKEHPVCLSICHFVVYNISVKRKSTFFHKCSYPIRAATHVSPNPNSILFSLVL